MQQQLKFLTKTEGFLKKYFSQHFCSFPYGSSKFLAILLTTQALTVSASRDLENIKEMFVMFHNIEISLNKIIIQKLLRHLVNLRG